MTQRDKRFDVTVLNNNRVRFIDYESNTKFLEIGFKEYDDAVDCKNALQWQCDLMNSLAEENEQLKQRNQKLDDKLYFKECDIFDLRKERNSFKERLFYLQNAINNAMEHQKAEIGVNALKDVIADYNDWVLGHKCGDFE